MTHRFRQGRGGDVPRHHCRNPVAFNPENRYHDQIVALYQTAIAAKICHDRVCYRIGSVIAEKRGQFYVDRLGDARRSNLPVDHLDINAFRVKHPQRVDLV